MTIIFEYVTLKFKQMNKIKQFAKILYILSVPWVNPVNVKYPIRPNDIAIANDSKTLV